MLGGDEPFLEPLLTRIYGVIRPQWVKKWLPGDISLIVSCYCCIFIRCLTNQRYMFVVVWSMIYVFSVYFFLNAMHVFKKDWVKKTISKLWFKFISNNAACIEWQRWRVFCSPHLTNGVCHRARCFPLPESPGQVKLPVGQVDLKKIFLFISYKQI